MIIKDNMANMCAKVTSTYMEFTLAFGPKPEFSFSFKFKDNMANMCAKVTSTYMEFTLAFGPKPEFSFSFKFTSACK